MKENRKQKSARMWGKIAMTAAAFSFFLFGGAARTVFADNEYSGGVYTYVDTAGNKQTVSYVAPTPWENGAALPATAGSYYLTTDVTIAATWEITEKNIDLDLNGHSITMTGDQTVIAVNDATFTLYDCIGTGKITGGKGSTGTDSSNGGGVAVGNNTGKSGADTFIMYGGSICRNSALGYGGGVMVFSSSSGGAKSFLMRGGTIEDNTAGTEAAGKCGGGVYIANGTFECSGTIRDNKAPGGNSGIGGNGGGVCFAGGTFDLLGTIRDNVAAGDGGGIYIINGGSVKVRRYPEAVGTICGNSASRNYSGRGGGAGVYVVSGTLEVDGLIEGNHAVNRGGGVCVDPGAAFHCSPTGVIRKNSAVTGGGVYLDESSSSATIDGTIEENSVSYFGGGINISGGSAVIGSTGEIRNNTTDVYGGGIYYHSGTLSCAGVIKGNKAPYKSGGGGGVFIDGNAFTLTGKIEENIAYNGGGVMLYGSSVLNVSGSAAIQNNKESESSDVSNDLRMSGDQKITVTGALNDDARIGIVYIGYLYGDPFVFTFGYEANNPGLTQPKHFFVSGGLPYAVKLQEGEAALALIMVTFDANGGDCSTSSAPANQGGGSVLPIASKTGYTHTGWYTAATGGDKITASTVFHADTTVYAHWTPTDYTIAYDLAGGSMSGEKTSYTIETDTFTLPQPTKPGYRFDGWSGAGIPSGTKEKTVTVAKGSTGERSYTAHYTAEEYTVTFDADGGSVTPGSKTITFGMAYGKLPTPVKDEARFKGWFTAKTGGTRIFAETIVSAAADHTLYAVWGEPGAEVRMVHAASSDGRTVYRAGEVVTVQAAETPEGKCAFEGWDVSGISIDAEQLTGKTLTFSMPENDVTVTALYKDHSPAKGVAVQPDCVRTGLTAGTHCSVCKAVLEAQEEIPALGHDFDCEWTVIREATEQEEGLRGKVCQNGCGRKQYADIPKKGSTSDSGNVSKYVEAAPDAPETFIGTDKESLRKLLTAEERNAVESGTNASIWLEVSKAAPTEDEEKKISECAEAVLGKGAGVSCYDISLFKRVGDSAEVQIHEPGMNITVTLVVPDHMLNRDPKLTRQYRIIRLHGGKADEVSSRYHEKTHEITFETDKFSVYAIAYLDKPVNGDQENTGSQAEESNAGSGNVTGSGAEDNPLDKVPKTGRLALSSRRR